MEKQSTEDIIMNRCIIFFFHIHQFNQVSCLKFFWVIFKYIRKTLCSDIHFLIQKLLCSLLLPC